MTTESQLSGENGASAPVEPSKVYNHTCMTCHVMFASADLHRDHFKSDWHRYNLKRKIAELTPISADSFRLKVIEMNAANTQINVDASGQRCETCNKFYQTTAALQNHYQSKRHIELSQNKVKTVDETRKEIAPAIKTEELLTEEDSDAETETESVLCGEAIKIETCLFCNTSSASLEDNLRHMSLQHGFFVVDLEYCIDLEGIVTYLGQKVGEGFVCLWCNEKGRKFHTLDAVQKHMIDKGHCRLFHDGDAMLEYADYYDYSPSYPDGESANGNEAADLDVSLPALEQNGFELMLPSGATIGHRSLFVYYKQNLKPDQAWDLVTIKKKASRQLFNHYKSIGWTGTTGEAARRKARDLKFLNKVYSKHWMQLGVKGNHCLQKHYKSQIDF